MVKANKRQKRGAMIVHEEDKPEAPLAMTSSLALLGEEHDTYVPTSAPCDTERGARTDPGPALRQAKVDRDKLEADKLEADKQEAATTMVVHADARGFDPAYVYRPQPPRMSTVPIYSGPIFMLTITQWWRQYNYCFIALYKNDYR